MNTDMFRAVYRDLTELMKQLGFEWVIRQVNETIEAGSQVEKATNIFKDESAEDLQAGSSFDEGFLPRRRGKAAQMMAVEPWSDSQKLEILIDAIRHAVGYAAEIEEAAITQLREVGSVKVIRFEAEEEQPSRTPLILSLQYREPARELLALLNSLETVSRQ